MAWRGSKTFVMDSVPLYWSVVFCTAAVKFLLLPSYKSTDFEVHRNWLAITHNFGKERWYFENTSSWTLDYPPFFAWFEYALSYVAVYFDPAMVKISNLNYESWLTVLFMRSSVIIADFLYAFAVYRCCKLIGAYTRKNADIWADDRFILCVLLLANAGLLIVDHVHFQYNGFLYGILLLSVVRMLENRHLEAAFWFAVLLNFKHIFLYMAPAYFVYLLRNFCLANKPGERVKSYAFSSLVQLAKLGLTVTFVFGLSFGPFIWENQLSQVLSRLFPFKRGLTHAYWAPNFWALYNVADRVVAVAGTKLELLNLTSGHSASMTRGLAQEYEHSCLPSVTPTITLALSILGMVPSLITLWKRPNQPLEFLRSLILCTFVSFLFGWHVHEKAILMIILPLSILAMIDMQHTQLYLILSTVGHYSLFPLLDKAAETPTKVLLFLLFTSYTFFSFSLKYSPSQRNGAWSRVPLLTTAESLFLYGLLGVQAYNGLLHPLLALDRSYPFLPLLLTSVYCAVGVCYVWIRMNWVSWIDHSNWKHLKVN